MKATKASIDKFLAGRKMAIAGVTRDPKEFGYQVYEQIKKTGVEVLVVHPIAEKIDGISCYKNIGVLPDDVRHLIIVTPKRQTYNLVNDAIAKGIGNIWIQQMSGTPEAIELAKANKINLVTGECIFMHTEPLKGVHKFHRTIRRLFGRMPV